MTLILKYLPICVFSAVLTFICLITGGLAQDAEQGVAYTVTFDIEGDPAVPLLELSLLDQLAATPPRTLGGVARRAEQDLDRFRAALRAEGYFNPALDATVAGQTLAAVVSGEAPDAGPGPVPVTVTIAPGPRYRITMVDLVDARDGRPRPPVPIDRADLGIASGDPARAAAILAAGDRLIAQMADQGHPFADVPVRQVFVDHASQTVELAYALEPGPMAAAGPLRITGTQAIRPAFLRRRAPVRPGVAYHPGQAGEIADDFRSLGVFSSVVVADAAQLDPEGRVPFDVTVTERPARFLGAGADFTTTEGAAARAFWGHRNLFGGAERLRVQAEVARLGDNAIAEPDLSGLVEFQKPSFLARRQDLRLELEGFRASPDGFEEVGFATSASLDRRLSDSVAASLGVSLSLREITETGVDDAPAETFAVVSLPGQVRRDSSDDLLNPTSGSRLAVSAAPSVDLLGTTAPFVRASALASAYRTLDDRGRLVLAARASVGTILGETQDNVPADALFFTGGGGSVRGYAFQGASPLDDDGDPIGGLSLVDFGVELRYRITETIGLVPFFDGGTVFEDAVPSVDQTLQFGAGIGVRYHTAIGPLRADFGIPVNPRADDDPFVLYFSIGQAF